VPKVSVTSGDFLKSYGSIVETALREPVTITSHGRERLVLLSMDEYRRLKEKDREPLYPWELGDSDLKALEVSEPPAAAAAFDHETKTK
jgi:prevent-host-death family protein